MYYPSNCNTLPAHTYDPCEDKEFGRIRSAGFIHIDLLPTFVASSPTAWLDGVSAGQIFIIPETNGESPKASPVYGPAYGKRPEVLLGYNFAASYSDPNYRSNHHFYKHTIGNMNYAFFFRTSSALYITDVPVSITPNREIQNDLTADITWMIDIKWLSKHFPCGIDTPDSVF